MQRTLIYSSLLIVFFAGFLALNVQADEPSKVLKLGHTTTFTGPGQLLVKGITEQSIKPLIEMINHKGGIKVGDERYKLELVIEDNKFTTPGGRAAAEKLIFREKVKYIVGDFSTSALRGELPLATENKTIIIAGGGILPSPEFPYYFVTTPSFSQRVYAILKVAKDKYPHLKRIAALNADDEAGLQMQGGFSKVFPLLGLESVYNERHPRGTTDYYPFFTRLLVQKPDAFMTISGPNEFAQMTKQLRELGYKGPILYCTGLGDVDSFIKVAGEKASQGVWTWYDDFKHPNAIPRVREFQEFYTKVLKRSPDDIHYAAHMSSIEVLVQALEKANTFDTEKLIHVLESSEFDTLLGRCRFEGKETYGIARKMNAVFRVGELSGKEWLHVGEAMLREP